MDLADCVFTGIALVATIPFHPAWQVSLSLFPPERFNFSSPDAWPCWSKRFERNCVASGFFELDGSVQVSMFTYAMGDQAEVVVASFGLQERFTKYFVYTSLHSSTSGSSSREKPSIRS